MKYSREFKIGLVAIITLALTIFGLNFLKGKNLLSPTKTYYMIYSNVADLKESAIVNLYGMKAGIVGSIYTEMIDGSEKVVVKIEIEKELKIPNDSYADLYSIDLLGTKGIRLKPGQSPIPFNDGDTIPSKFSPGLNEQLDDILLKVDNVLVNLEQVTTQINTIFNNENADKIDGVIDNLSNISTSVNGLLSPEGALTKSINALDNTLAVIESNTKTIDNSLSNIESLTDTLNQLHLTSLVDSTMMAVGKAYILLDNINNGTGTLGQLAVNDSLFKNLNNSTESLNNLLLDLKENPKSYVHFSLFGKND